MKLKSTHGLAIGLVAGLIIAHLYHTQTAGPGTLRSKTRG